MTTSRSDFSAGLRAGVALGLLGVLDWVFVFMVLFRLIPAWLKMHAAIVILACFTAAAGVFLGFWLVGFAGFSAARVGGRRAGLTAIAVVAVGAVVVTSLAVMIQSVAANMDETSGLAPVLLATMLAPWFFLLVWMYRGVQRALLPSSAAPFGSAVEDASPLGVSAAADPNAHHVVTPKWNGLWAEIDRDRLAGLWWFFALVGLALLGLALIFGLVNGFTREWLGSVASVAAYILGISAVVYLILPKPRHRLLGAVALPADDPALIRTQSALNSIHLAAGGPGPELLFYESDSLNAYVSRAAEHLSFSVSRSFSTLPTEEQVAGFALLIGRLRVDERGHFERPLFNIPGERTDLNPPATWLAVAKRGDREGLLILKDPQPILELLGRLASSNTVVEEASGDTPPFGFLAWPFPQSGSAGLTGCETPEAERPAPPANPEEARRCAILAIAGSGGPRP